MKHRTVTRTATRTTARTAVRTEAKGEKTPSTDAAVIRYRIEPVDPKGHLFEVVCDVANPASGGQRFALPAWIPGSYMIREFARHIVTIAAESAGRAVELVKTDKHSWQAAHCDGALRLRYRVYAWDASVRAAHLDETHGFFNGTSVFLRVTGQEHLPHEVDLRAPAGRRYRDWQVATTLPELGAARHGFGTYRADDYDALVDHPVEMGTFRLERFAAAGVLHEIAWTGAVPNFDAERVNADVALLCAAQIRFFAEESPVNAARAAREARDAAPFDRYVFLTAVSADGYGGLEHRASTALTTTRDGLPVMGDSQGEARPAYLAFLGLVSHEYFHSWNVKRIKPAAFVPYDLTKENYTSLLWIFEGFTSYYDDLFLVRTGLATQQQYLGLVARTIDDVAAGLGRTTQSVAESSFDAWVKYYRQDENAPNAVVSYYKKGSLVALCLDLLIRDRSRGRHSLDSVMRLMWFRYGRDFYDGSPQGIGEEAFPELVREATGVDVADEVRAWAHGTSELPLATLLSRFGLVLRQDAPVTASLGARVAANGTDARLASVLAGGPAHVAGLSAGDVLVAVDGLRVSATRSNEVLARYRPGDSIEVAFFRNDVLMQRTLTLGVFQPKTTLEVSGKASARADERRGAWLGRELRQDKRKRD